MAREIPLYPVPSVVHNAPGVTRDPTRHTKAPVHRWEGLEPESRLAGPCLVESEHTTLAVPDGWTFYMEPNGWAHLMR